MVQSRRRNIPTLRSWGLVQMAKGWTRVEVQGQDERESEAEQHDEEEYDPTTHRRKLKHRKGKVNDEVEWVTILCKKHTRKEAHSLIGCFTAISTQSHHDELLHLIKILCNIDPEYSQIDTHQNSFPHTIYTLTHQYESIIFEMNVLDFQCMIVLM
jgi:hypothetical protein